MLTAHSTWAMSATTSAFDVVPLGVETVVVSSHSGRPGGDALLVEGLAGRAVGEALQHGRPPAGGVQQMLGDVEVVGDQVELGRIERGEVHLVRS